MNTCLERGQWDADSWAFWALFDADGVRFPRCPSPFPRLSVLCLV